MLEACSMYDMLDACNMYDKCLMVCCVELMAMGRCIKFTFMSCVLVSCASFAHYCCD